MVLPNVGKKKKGKGKSKKIRGPFNSKKNPFKPNPTPIFTTQPVKENEGGRIRPLPYNPKPRIPLKPKPTPIDRIVTIQPVNEKEYADREKEERIVTIQPVQEKEDNTLVITGDFKDGNGCIKGEEKYNIETKQCEKIEVEYRLYDFNQSQDIISEERTSMYDRQIDENLIDSELLVDDEVKILKKDRVRIDDEIKRIENRFQPNGRIRIDDEVKKIEDRAIIEDEIKNRRNNQKYDGSILDKTISEPVEKEIPVTVVTRPVNVPKIDVHGCSPNGNPPTFYCENSGKCENINSYNFKNNLCKKEDEEKYNENKEAYYFKVGILVVIVLIIIIGMVYFLNKN